MPWLSNMTTHTVHVEWESSDESEEEDHTPMERALLTLPLKIRSQNVSWSDVDEMEHSLQRTIFHPMRTNHLNNRPNECHVSVEWDAQTAVTTASASCKCVLASLIRVVSDLTPSLYGSISLKPRTQQPTKRKNIDTPYVIITTQHDT